MKQLLKVLALILVFILAISVMVACDDDKGNGDTTNDGGTTDDGGDKDDDKADTTAKFTVTFKYIDADGNDLPDVDGYKEGYHKNIKYGNNARDNKSGDVKLFANYVIVGWNADKAAAMAGTVDENALNSIKDNKTVYSVVREKEMKTVTFLKSDGVSVAGTKDYLEGEAIGKDAPRPTELGKYFKKWEFVSNNEEGKTDSNETCIYGDCTFKAVMGATDGTIGLAAKNTIVVDGKKDDAYVTSNTMLAHNNKKVSNNSKTVAEGGSYCDPGVVKTDNWLVWDGDYIYLYIAVYDTKLTCRSEAYVRGGIDSWCNDAVELWYTFEQDAALTKNNTRVCVSAGGDIDGIKGTAKYALPRSEYKGSITGIFGGRSTHYDEIDYAVRNYINEKETGGDTSGLDQYGIANPSYTVEFKIPAYTEGQADLDYAYEDWDAEEPSKKLTGDALNEFKTTGRLYGVDAKVDNINSYRFTTGDKLLVGDYVRFALQINDLRISIDDLNPQANKYLDAPTLEEAKKATKDDTLKQADLDAVQIKLYQIDTNTGKLKSASTHDLFTAAGSTQNTVSMYLMFSLGGDAEGSYIVHDFRKHTSDSKEQVMLTKVLNETTGEWEDVVYTRPTVVE